MDASWISSSRRAWRRSRDGEREDEREREGDARTRGNRAMCGMCASMTDVCVV